ncbi:MAG: Omp28 family outer membrane lipoprotein [Bacteroides sp.]|nr:Omp28 family outer membrane lipoprotein [Bacteroides sp.]MCM1084890.1 Omp28 family outer membrane lipoprotein [Bacteroides sp.]
MKTIKYIGGLVLVGLLAGFISCDKIKDGNRLIDQGVVEVKSNRCVLLEDYTGVRCVNCPEAAEEIKTLQAAYGNKLVVVEMHPKGMVSSTLPIDDDPDLRTEIAQTYATAFQINSLPTGLVNRGGKLNWQSWSGAIKEVFDDTTSDYVNLAASVKVSGSSVQVNVNGNFKKDYLENGDINVIVMLVENNIVTQQEGLNGQHFKEYVHNHVLRTVVSDDVWGDKIADATPTEGTDFTKQYTATVSGEWKVQDLAVVVAVVNASTRSVLQAAYAHIQ